MEGAKSSCAGISRKKPKDGANVGTETETETHRTDILSSSLFFSSSRISTLHKKVVGTEVMTNFHLVE